MADDLKSVVSDAAEALATVREEIEKAGFKGIFGGLFNRFPAGSAKGGQFAPKGQGGGGGNDDPADTGKPKPNPGAVPHPKTDDKGKTVHINYPTKPSAPDTWHDPNATASFAAGQKDFPDAVNGVKFTDAQTPADWSKVKGTNPKLDADMPFVPSPDPKKSIGAGVIILEDDGRIWLTKPTNEFGGYVNTFPKGTAEPGLTLQQNAIKEAFEESGLQIKITGVLGDFERTTSKARFYLAKRVGGSPKNMGWESQGVRMAPLKNARKLLNRDVDQDILDELDHLLSFEKFAKLARLLKGSWATQARWPQGSPLGGQWKAVGGDGLTIPPKIAGGHEGKNAVYQKAVDGAHKMAQGGDAVGAVLVANKYAGAAGKFAAGQISSSHVKWGAQAHQYAVQLKADLDNKGKATVIADRISGPTKLSAMGPQTAPKPGGTNPGGLHGEWLVKGNKQFADGNQPALVSDLRAHNEVLASKLLMAAGVGAPEMKLVDLEGKHGGGLGVASKMVPGLQKLDVSNPQHLAAAQADFAVNAWVGNWDALGTGFDNTMIHTASGKAVCIDPGGSLLFRAQGALKTPNDPLAALDPGAKDFTTMRGTDAYQKSVYGKMTAPQLQASAEKLKAISNDQIKTLVDTYGGGDQKFKDTMTARLIARKQSILNQAQVAANLAAPVEGIPDLPSAKAGAPKVEQKTATQVMQDKAAAAQAATAKMQADTYRAALNNNPAQLATSNPVQKLDNGGTFMANQHFMAKDTVALAKHASELATSYKEAAGSVGYPPAELTKLGQTANYAVQKLVQLQAQNILAGQVQAPPPPQPKGALDKPTFNSGFKGADKFYTQMADDFAMLHASGDLKALQAAATAGKYEGGQPWKPGSKSGEAIKAYHQALVNDLEGKQASAAVVAMKQTDAAISVKAPTGNAAPQTAGALPNFDAAKLQGTNTNASSHNAKVDTISNLANNGDVKGLLSLNYGTNTYGKQQAKLANATLAALGSTYTVTPGQKKGEHPALNGGVTPKHAAVFAAKVQQPMPGQSAVIDQSKLDMSKAPPLDVPQFAASSKQWVNDQNAALAAEIKAVYQSGNLTALSSMTFKVIDKETGKETGEVKHISAAPSKSLVGIYDQAVGQLKDIANPPAPLKHFDGTAAKSIADLDANFPSKPMGTVVQKQPKNEQLGFWLALGKVSDHEKFVPKQTQDVSSAAISAGPAKYKAMSAPAKKFVQHMQASGNFATSYRNGAQTHGGDDLKTMAIEAEKHATAHPAGTKIYRYQSMPADMIKKIMSAEPGTIFQATGPMPTSYHPTATQGFGANRMEIIFAPGAKAIDSFGSGSFQGEKEITTLPNARFVLISAKPRGKGGHVDMKLLMLPPDLGLGTKPKRRK